MAVPPGELGTSSCLEHEDCGAQQYCALGVCVQGAAPAPEIVVDEGFRDEVDAAVEQMPEFAPEPLSEPSKEPVGPELPTELSPELPTEPGPPDVCQPSPEVCNGKDDDCDGKIDNGVMELKRPCTPNGIQGVCAIGEITGCEKGALVCTGGTPAPEICDNLDNDCDGQVDEDFVEAGNACAVPGGKGICSTGTFTQCVDGKTLCTGPSSAIEICDGKDNDCDGSIDEEFPDEGKTCQVSGVMGVCVHGVWACQQSQKFCQQIVFPVAEACRDGKDNNCDGQIDENPPCACTPADTQSCFSADLGLIGVGECKAGTQTCEANSSWGACVGEVSPVAEICDGKDNDCNGLTDDLTFPATETCTALAPTAWQRCMTGKPVCQSGSRVCILPTLKTETVIGGKGFSEGKLAPCTQANIGGPFGLALAATNDLYVVSPNTHEIYKIDATGKVTVLAGDGTNGYVDDPIGTKSKFNSPRGLALDGAGHLFVADTGNHRIRKIVLATGAVTPLAGGQAGMQDGVGATAGFNQPYALAWNDTKKVLYVADSNNHLIRSVDLNGMVTTIAGSGKPQHADGLGKKAAFNQPRGLAYDSANDWLYVADFDNHCIRKIVLSTGDVTSVVGIPKTSGTADGPLEKAQLNGPIRLAFDASGDLLIVDQNNRMIRRAEITLTGGQVSVFAGVAGMSGFRNGITSQATFALPSDIIADGKGGYLVADADNQMLRLIENSRVRSFAGSKGGNSFLAGDRLCATLSRPAAAIFDSAKKLMYLTDIDFHVVFRVDFARNLAEVFAGDGTFGKQNGFRLQASFNQPQGMAFDSLGNLYVADTENHLIRKIDAQGTVSTFAGDGQAGFKNDPFAIQARFNKPMGLAFDASGILYVADSENHCIRAINPTGTVAVTTHAGTCQQLGNDDGVQLNAKFSRPVRLVFNASNELFVVDQGNHRIRKIDAQGNVSTYAGGNAGKGDGTGTAASFDSPTGIAWEAGMGLLIADTNNHRIRRINASQDVLTISGNFAGLNNDIDANALFSGPSDVAIDSKGNIYVLDRDNSALRLLPACP